jgi:hypothetical protein
MSLISHRQHFYRTYENWLLVSLDNFRDEEQLTSQAVQELVEYKVRVTTQLSGALLLHQITKSSVAKVPELYF